MLSVNPLVINVYLDGAFIPLLSGITCLSIHTISWDVPACCIIWYRTMMSVDLSIVRLGKVTSFFWAILSDRI